MKTFRLFCSTLILAASTSMFGMGKARHLRGAGKIGGINDLRYAVDGVKYTRSDGERISAWMDNPATRPGECLNWKAGGVKLSPSNHNSLRHNPKKAGRALSGTGEVDAYVRDVARIHKIQDVFNNKVKIDGWEITPEMRAESKRILEYLKTHERLPKKLPVWVDAEGGWIYKRALNATEKSRVLMNLGKSEGARVGQTANAFPMSSEMMKKTEAIRRYVRKYGKLPKGCRIPGFLYMRQVGGATSTKALPGVDAVLAGGGVELAEHYILPVFVVIQGVCFALEWSEIDDHFERGEVDQFEKVELRSICIGKNGGLAVGLVVVPIVDLFLSPLIVVGGFGGLVIIGAVDVGIFYVAEFLGERIGGIVGKPLANYLKEDFERRVVLETNYHDALNEFSAPPETLMVAGIDKAELRGYVAALKKFSSKLKTRKKRAIAFPSKDDFFAMENVEFYNGQLGE